MILESGRGAHSIPPLAIVAAGLSLLAAIVGFLVPSGRIPVVGEPTLIAGAAALLILLGHPSRLSLGLALLPVIGAVIPIYLRTGRSSDLAAALALAALLLVLWVAQALLTRDLVVASSPVNSPALALALVWVVSLLYGIATRPALVEYATSESRSRFLITQIGGLAVLVVSVGVLLLAVNVGREHRWTRLAVWGFLGVGALAIAAHYLRLTQASAFLSTSGLFTMWVVALALGQAVFNEKLALAGRAALLALAGAWLYKSVLTETIWYSGWVPTVIALAVLVLFRSRWLFVALLVATAIYVLADQTSLRLLLWDQFVVGDGSTSRLDIWAQTLEVVRASPVLGTGPAGHTLYFMSIFRGSEFSMSTHSNYFDVLVQTGVLGFAVFAWLLIALFTVAWRATRVWRSGFEAAFARGALAGYFGLLVAMALGDWLIPFVYNQTIAGFRYTVHSWVFLGLVAALAIGRPDAPRSERPGTLR